MLNPQGIRSSCQSRFHILDPRLFACGIEHLAGSGAVSLLNACV